MIAFHQKLKAKPSPTPQSYFHSVTQLKPDVDLQHIATGVPSFSNDRQLWQQQMQELYLHLFAMENVFFNVYNLNAHLSEELPILRDVPDSRLGECHQFVAAQNLPKVSIIIPFHNEQYSFLVRTLHSVIDKTPAELIHEIILVDDASDKKNLVYAFPRVCKTTAKGDLFFHDCALKKP